MCFSETVAPPDSCFDTYLGLQILTGPRCLLIGNEAFLWVSLTYGCWAIHPARCVELWIRRFSTPWCLLIESAEFLFVSCTYGYCALLHPRWVELWIDSSRYATKTDYRILRRCIPLRNYRWISLFRILKELYHGNTDFGKRDRFYFPKTGSFRHTLTRKPNVLLRRPGILPSPRSRPFLRLRVSQYSFFGTRPQ